MKNNMQFKIFIFYIIVFLTFSRLTSAEYKITTSYNIFDMPGSDNWVSGDEYSIKTTWEATGE